MGDSRDFRCRQTSGCKCGCDKTLLLILLDSIYLHLYCNIEDLFCTQIANVNSVQSCSAKYSEMDYRVKISAMTKSYIPFYSVFYPFMSQPRCRLEVMSKIEDLECRSGRWTFQVTFIIIFWTVFCRFEWETAAAAHCWCSGAKQWQGAAAESEQVRGAHILHGKIKVQVTFRQIENDLRSRSSAEMIIHISSSFFPFVIVN